MIVMVERPSSTDYPVRRDIVEQNAFDSQIELPEQVCILAPGPNGRYNWDKIGDMYVIAVNYAVTIPVHIDMWLSGDWWGIQKPWFPKADKGFYGTRVFAKGLAERCETWNEQDRWFDLVKRREIERSFKEERPNLRKRFRPDETSVGIAIDFAGRFGATEINLCGVDLKGYEYYDGTLSTCESCDRSGIWLFADMIQDVVEWYENKGVSFFSFSETALRVDIKG